MFILNYSQCCAREAIVRLNHQRLSIIDYPMRTFPTRGSSVQGLLPYFRAGENPMKDYLIGGNTIGGYPTGRRKLSRRRLYYG